jgi:HK97 family phage major capsid protein
MGQTLADFVAHVPGLERLRTKATVLGGTTANLGELAGDVAAREYLNLMAKRTVLRRLTGTLTAPLHVQIPTPATDPTPYWIQEGAPMPLSLMSFTDARTSISKFGVVRAFTRELFRVADDRAVSLIERITLRALVRAEDTLLLSASAASGNIPAGLPNGLSAIGGGSPESFARRSRSRRTNGALPR